MQCCNATKTHLGDNEPASPCRFGPPPLQTESAVGWKRPLYSSFSCSCCCCSCCGRALRLRCLRPVRFRLKDREPAISTGFEDVSAAGRPGQVFLGRIHARLWILSRVLQAPEPTIIARPTHPATLPPCDPVTTHENPALLWYIIGRWGGGFLTRTASFFLFLSLLSLSDLAPIFDEFVVLFSRYLS